MIVKYFIKFGIVGFSDIKLFSSLLRNQANKLECLSLVNFKGSLLFNIGR